MKQLTIFRRGGKRRGAGRKPKGNTALVAHAKREKLNRHTPVHVTTRVRAGLPDLRDPDALAVVHAAFAAATDRFGFRLTDFTVQANHFHLIAEADNQRALGRGMKGLLVRLARGLNRLWKRTGSVFADRFHEERLRTPKQARNALNYVLNNARKHGIHFGKGVDPFSSGAWFDGWLEKRCARIDSADKLLRAPLSRARSWLRTTGWRRHGLISLHEVPRS